jgi:uncharacterized membrane protein
LFAVLGARCNIRFLTSRNNVMGKERLAAFSDGVIAIIITIMVLG